jgi:hypothetical protein
MVRAVWVCARAIALCLLLSANQAELAKLADWSDESLAHACAKIRYPHLRQPDPLEVLAGSAQKHRLAHPLRALGSIAPSTPRRTGLMYYLLPGAPAPGAGPIGLCGP